MKVIKNHFVLLLVVLCIASCEEKGKILLPSAEERVNEAVSSLKSDLISPSNGWKLEYQPTNESGVFFMLLDFKDDGTVRIRSDVADNEGEFFDHTITWRIDNALGLELIFETYGVFHYMFEQDAASFGAEFEFVFKEKNDENLIFRSKSDVTSLSPDLIFTHASSGDNNLFAREIAQNLNQFATIGPKALETPVPRQQIILDNINMSVFWSLDPAKRIIRSSVAAEGSGFTNAVILDHQSGYKLQNGRMEIMQPLQFILNNTVFTIASIAFDEYSATGPSFCLTGAGDGPNYKGQVPALGNVSMVGSLFDLEGTAFQPMADLPYSVNSFFIFDENEESLSDEGKIISDRFPTATAFLFYYGFTSDDQPANAVGFLLDDNNGNVDFFLREYQETMTEGNKISIKLINSYYHSGTPSAGDQANLAEITDLLFEGEDMYAFDFPAEDLSVFKLFNPCNRHEIFLVR